MAEKNSNEKLSKEEWKEKEFKNYFHDLYSRDQLLKATLGSGAFPNNNEIARGGIEQGINILSQMTRENYHKLQTHSVSQQGLFGAQSKQKESKLSKEDNQVDRLDKVDKDKVDKKIK